MTMPRCKEKCSECDSLCFKWIREFPHRVHRCWEHKRAKPVPYQRQYDDALIFNGERHCRDCDKHRPLVDVIKQTDGKQEIVAELVCRSCAKEYYP